MIIGFSRHGTGAGHGPVNYLVSPSLEHRENNPPIVVRGDAVLTRQLIDSLDFKHKYTSGVLSFARGEIITEQQEQHIMARFEEVAFAGLEADQYNILFVRHTHAGHHELHFVTPRVELSTGKSLNIRPPGDVTKAVFDDLRSEINARYGLADPDDPTRARDARALPHHELKVAAQAIREGKTAPDNIRTIISEAIIRRIEDGAVCNRDDVVNEIKNLGFTVTRAGDHYVTAADPQSGQRWRLKGPIYEQNFTPRQLLKNADAREARDYSKPDRAAFEHYQAKVERHIKKRREYHQNRYLAPTAAMLRSLNIYDVTMSNGRPPEHLDQFMDLHLTVEPLYQPPPPGGSAKTEAGTQEEHVLSNSNEELTHDRARNPLIESLTDVTARIRRATQSLTRGARKFTENVRRYVTESPNLIEHEQAFKRAIERFEYASRELAERTEQIIRERAARNASPKPRGRRR